MVGVDDYKEVNQAQMEWLKNGGRNRIERMARRFMNIWKKAGKKGDFYLQIDLPSDILVVAREKGVRGCVFWRFDFSKMKMAEELYADLKEQNHDLETLIITNVKEFLTQANNLTIRIGVTWHGHDAYWYGLEYCSIVIPERLFPQGI